MAENVPLFVVLRTFWGVPETPQNHSVGGDTSVLNHHCWPAVQAPEGSAVTAVTVILPEPPEPTALQVFVDVQANKVVLVVFQYCSPLAQVPGALEASFTGLVLAAADMLILVYWLAVLP